MLVKPVMLNLWPSVELDVSYCAIMWRALSTSTFMSCSCSRKSTSSGAVIIEQLVLAYLPAEPSIE